MEEFKVPQNYSYYINSIKERCLNLIRVGIWTGINQSSVNAWLNNFKTIEEKYFAACVLDSLIYRSEAQTISLIFQLLYRSLPNLARLSRFNTGINFNNLIEALRSRDDPKIRIVTVTSYSLDPTKSTHIVVRLLKTKFRVNPSWIIDPHRIQYDSDVEAFIFLDDFLGTGDQFIEICDDEIIINEKINNLLVIYAPLVAHVKGIDRLKKDLPKLKVTCAEILDNSSAFFDLFFNDGLNRGNVAREFYKSLLAKYRIPTGGDMNILGYGNLELTYAFYHSVPDNSLRILWHEPEDKSWMPLFHR